MLLCDWVTVTILWLHCGWLIFIEANMIYCTHGYRGRNLYFFPLYNRNSSTIPSEDPLFDPYVSDIFQSDCFQSVQFYNLSVFWHFAGGSFALGIYIPPHFQLVYNDRLPRLVSFDVAFGNVNNEISKVRKQHR